MRGTFGIVLASGIALAVGWSVFRRGVIEERSPLDGPVDEPSGGGGAVHRDLPAPTPGERKLVRVAPPAASPSALADLMSAAIQRGDADSAANAYLAAAAAARADPQVRTRALETADRLIAAGEQNSATTRGLDARMLARRVLGAFWDCDDAAREERDRAFSKSQALFDLLMKGGAAPADALLRHKIASGENLWTLARGPWKQAGVTVPPGFVLWVNGMTDARRLRVGQSLRVPREPLTIVVRKSEFELTVLLGGAPFARFPVAVGADAKTPVGVFAAKDCLKNPDWYMNGRRIPFGSPENLLGTRWIGFTGTPQAEGIGIHGTNDETTIGQAVSLGCVRMRNADVETVFEWVSAGSRIEIRD